ncbi:MAG: hypothetical protein Crog4KO_11630 [Crocinitomicaceae bacterium]
MKIFLVIVSLLSFPVFAQTGLYGRRSIVEVQGIGSMPIVYNFFNGLRPFYNQQGDNLVDGRNLIEYGCRVNVMRAFTNQIGIGAEFGYERQIMSAPDFINLQYFNGFNNDVGLYDLRHEKIRLNTITFMPKIEISSRTNLLPIGLSHQVGFGYTRVSVDERNYTYIVQNSDNDSIITPTENGFLNYDYTYTGFTFMYQINMRTPITDQIVLTYGIRYNGNFVRRRRPSDGFSSVGEFDMINEIRDRRNPAFVQLNFGIGYAF